MSAQTSTRTLCCSFCGKSQHKVKKLIAGPSVFICNECVDICVDILSENDGCDEWFRVTQKPPTQTEAS